MKILALSLFSITMVGCAHRIDPASVSSVNVYTTRDAKIPGKYNLIIDDNIKSITKEIKMSSHACSAHTYPMAVGDPLTQSIRNATRSAFEQASEVSNSGAPLADFSGSIFYRLEDFQTRLSCNQSFWAINCTATTEIGMNVVVKDNSGKVLVNTAANSSRSAEGEAGSMCDKAGNLAGESFTKATKEVLERLLERVSNAKL
ncbi:MAG: hypothetical protein PHQ58_08395 [Rhodoferax sp.]|uniref:hypothetical protein n=1 Tax=Rhodoferax sp. TaxID=50421 RepID=UPI002615EAA9|nr:hypothetical protein [Rhodoferax sp.]MDD2880445.1 hypothetical protein [Rhodoferax sp.]